MRSHGSDGMERADIPSGTSSADGEPANEGGDGNVRSRWLAEANPTTCDSFSILGLAESLRFVIVASVYTGLAQRLGFRSAQ
jgi:hypothetical protein